MAEAFVELGAEGVNHVADKYWDHIYDAPKRVTARRRSRREKRQSCGRQPRSESASPERERGPDRDRLRQDSLERESARSERVTRAYREEADDPVRPVDPVFFAAGGSTLSGNKSDSKMAYNDRYRANSAQPPRTRYYDDDGGSDYDEREGRRYRATGRGYDDDDRSVDREIIETERYRGPPRPYDPRRYDSYGQNLQPRGYNNNNDDVYGAGAVAPYRRSHNDLTAVPRRSRSRGRHDRYDRDSRSRSRSGSRGENWKEKLDDTFDTSWRGLGVALAGAAVGGIAGRQIGKDSRHTDRDVLIGAAVGGLAANVLENKWAERRERKAEEKEERWEEKWDGRNGYGRSRSTGR